MRIGFDAKRATQNFTGLGNYSRFVINNLAEYYPENAYVLFSPKTVPAKIKSEISESENLKIVVKEEGFKPFWRSFGISESIRNEKIDLYHGLSNELPFSSKKTNAKLVLTIHDLIFLKHPQFYSPIDRKIYDKKARFSCSVADKIVAVSECTKRDIMEHYGVDEQKIEVVYQGCFSIFRDEVLQELKDDVLRKYSIPSRFILSIGTIEERKNILLIVKALKLLPDIHLVAIGKEREYAKEVRNYIMENGLENRVHFKSNVPLADLPAILQSSEIFVYPSIYEGFGIPIVEALSSGVPVIAATGSCLEEAGGPNSIYVNPFDSIELSNQINNVISNQQLRSRMIDEGLKYVERFSDKNCTESMWNVYQKLF